MPWGPENITKARAANRKIKGRFKVRDVPSDRERAVAQYLVGGMTQKAAFVKAGYSIGTDEYRVLTRPAVVRYIEEVRERAVTRFDYPSETLCARLEHISAAALASGEYAPAISAVMGIAKMMGHLADRTEIEMHIISQPARETTSEVRV